MKVLFVALYLSLFLGLFTACSDDPIQSTDDESLIAQEVDKIKHGVARGQIMANSNGFDRESIDSILITSRAAALKLKRDPQSRSALRMLVTNLKALQRFGFLQEDQNDMNQFFRVLGAEIQRYAKIQGTTIDNVKYSMYTYRFSDGLEPFGTFNEGGEWTVRESLDIWHTSMYSRSAPSKFKGWLLTPAFDFTNVKNPSFRITHEITAEKDYRSNKPFSTTDIINETFKVLVTTKYNVGNPSDLDVSDWTEVKLGGRLAGTDYDKGSTPSVDLSMWEGQENVTIAFVVDFDSKRMNRFGNPIGAGHLISWRLDQFDLEGLGPIPAITPRASDIYEKEFTNKVLKDGYVIKNMIPDSINWKPGGYPRDPAVKWYLAEARRNDIGDSWLISPKIVLKGVQFPLLKLDLNVKNPIWEHFNIYISESYDGESPLNHDWTPIEYKPLDSFEINKYPTWSVTQDLSKYVGKKIVLALRYKTDETSSSRPDWDVFKNYRTSGGREQFSVLQIKKVVINAIGDKIRYEKIDYKFEVPTKAVSNNNGVAE